MKEQLARLKDEVAKTKKDVKHAAKRYKQEHQTEEQEQLAKEYAIIVVVKYGEACAALARYEARREIGLDS